MSGFTNSTSKWLPIFILKIICFITYQFNINNDIHIPFWEEMFPPPKKNLAVYRFHLGEIWDWGGIPPPPPNKQTKKTCILIYFISFYATLAQCHKVLEFLLYTCFQFECEFTHLYLHVLGRENRKQTCWCEPGFSIGEVAFTLFRYM
jgi:hypothetical protein